MKENSGTLNMLLCGAFHLVRTHLGEWGGGGVKSPIHFHCVLHAKRGEGPQIACKIAYVLNGRPLSKSVMHFLETFCRVWLLK